MAKKIEYYDRNDFYDLEIFEKELGYSVCHCECHHINRDIIEEMECCRQLYEKYLLNVGGRTYILRSYADKLLGDKAENFVDHYNYYRRENNIEWDYRTPKHVHGELDHKIYPPEKHKHKVK